MGTAFAPLPQTFGVHEFLRNFGFFLYSLYLLTAAWMLLSAGLQLHLLWHYRRARPVAPPPLAEADLPVVTVQLPLYNEPRMVEGLLASVAALDYPWPFLEVQVLDDSTDETAVLLDRAAAPLKASGFPLTILRRGNRRQYKAGALQAGLAEARGTFVAIFDADFRPEPDFLRRLLPSFAHPRVGLVQARWAHQNREASALTRIQTFLLDTHFSVEQGGRAQAGYCINFCGTAGIWRRSCIEDAGGWDGTVLSEDLDLSYRAQLRGWEGVYRADVAVPAELPETLAAFRVQQERWTKGMAQASRKLLHGLWQAPYSFGRKLHGSFHLLGSFLFVCLLVNALLTVPLLLYRSYFPEFIPLTNATMVTGLNLVALTLVYHAGLHSGAQRPGRFWSDYLLFLLVYMALSVQNAGAVLQGFAGRTSPFIRTPKGGLRARDDHRTVARAEWMVWGYFLLGIALSVGLQDYFLLLFFVLFSTGLGWLRLQSLREEARISTGSAQPRVLELSRK